MEGGAEIMKIQVSRFVPQIFGGAISLPMLKGSKIAIGSKIAPPNGCYAQDAWAYRYV